MIIKLDNKTAEGKQIYRFDCVVDSRRRNVSDTKHEVIVADNKQVESVEVENEADMPTSSGHVRDSWRLISAVEAWPSSGFHLPQLIDYSHNNGEAIRGAINHINQSKPDLTWNHSTDAKDVAGWVENAYWEDSTDIPSGVNADLVVDPQYDVKAAKGLENKVLRNGSIGFSMDVIPSHEDMPFEKFTEMQGKLVGNEKVRWLPVAVHDVLHMALVPAGTGADKFAGRREFGNQSTISSNKVEVEKEDTMLEDSVRILANSCQVLGIDVALVADENASIPDGLEERLAKKIETLATIQKQYNTLATSVEKVFSKASESGLEIGSLADLENEIPRLCKWAEEGEKVLCARRDEALEWYDKVKFQPDVEMSASAKRIRERLSNSRDLEYINDIIDEYRSAAEEKFGNTQRTSIAEELPIKSENVSNFSPDIIASVARIFKDEEK